MANVRALSGATGDDFKALEDAALEMGSKTSMTAKDSADALGFMASAGWSVQESIAGLEPMIRLAEAGELDLETASALATDSMANLGISVGGMAGFFDKAAKAGAASNASTQQMLEAYIGVGANLKDMNAGLDESAALLGVMANRGIKGSEAGNSLNAILMNLRATTGSSGKAMKQLGISMFDTQGNYRNLEDILVGVKDKLSGMTEEQAAWYKDMIAGKNQSAGFSAILDGLGNEYANLKSDIANSDGALNEMAGTMNNTYQGAMKRLESAADDLKIRVVKIFADDMTGAINWAAETIPKFTEKIIGGLKWIKSEGEDFFKWAWGNLENTPIGDFVKKLSDIKLGLDSIFRGDVKMGAARIMSELGLDAEQIRAGLKGIDLIKSGVKKLFSGDFFGAAGSFLDLFGFSPEAKKSVLTAIAEISAGFEKVKGFIVGMVSAAGAQIPKILPIIGDVVNFFSSKLGPIVGRVLGFITNTVLPPLVLFFQNNIPKIVNIVKGLWEILKPIITALMNQIKGAFDFLAPIVGTGVEFITNTVSSIITVLEGVVDFIAGVFTGDWDRAWQGTKEIFSGIWDSFISIGEFVINFLTDLVNGFIKFLNGIKLPDWLGGGLNIPEIQHVDFTGGEKESASTIPKLASGGMVDRPTLAMIGEGREKEAVFPLSKLTGLLKSSASNVLNSFIQNSASNAPAAPQIVYSPNIIINGDADKNMVQRAVDKGYDDFRRFMDKYMRDRNRLTLAPKNNRPAPMGA